MTRRSRKQGGSISENIIKSTKRKSLKWKKSGAKSAKKRRKRQVKVLEHPDITRALRTGYPAPIKPVEPVDPAVIVTDEEFAEIVARRKAKGGSEWRN
jgi:hypothetical protein